MIGLAALAIVFVLVGVLFLGVGLITGKPNVSTAITTEFQTIQETQTQVQAVTQTILSTTTLAATNSAVTTTATSLSVSQTTLHVPTTVNVTELMTTTVTQISSKNITTTASGYAVLDPQGTKIVFAAGQSSEVVNQQEFQGGFNGYLQVTYQTNTSTPVHWVLLGNGINESSISAPSGGFEFPVQAYVPYTITVVNDACSIAICNNAFNVTASIVYEW